MFRLVLKVDLTPKQFERLVKAILLIVVWFVR